MTTLIAVVSDTHLNSTVALCPPRVYLDDGGIYRASKEQKSVWQAWNKFWQIIAEKKGGNKLYTIVNGDTIDINTHDGIQLISHNRNVIISLAVAVLQPIAEMSDALFIIRGTETHTGRAANIEETIARELGAEPLVKPTIDKKTGEDKGGIYSWWWLPLEVEGLLFDITHHPKTSGWRPWTRDAAAAREAAIIRNDYWERGDKPPDIALRGHVHYHADSGKTKKPHVLITPSWSLTDAYGHRKGTGGSARPVGGLWLMCDNGHYDYEFEVWWPKRRRAWTGN